MKRLFVTGLGCLSALGNDRHAFADGLRNATAGIGPLTAFDASGLTVRIAGEVRGFDPAAHFEKSRLGQMDRFAQLAVVSAREAVAHSGLTIDDTLAPRIAVVHGTGAGGQLTQDDSYRLLYGENAKRLHPFTVPKLMPSAGPSQVSMDLGITGPVFGTTSACASSGHAIAMGGLLLRAGLADVALVGGAEAALTYGSLKGWESLRVMAHDTCRPFSQGRGGMVLGEGAGTLVLETEDHARARGARPLAELAGLGMNADAGNLIQPDVNGMARAIRAALDDAGLSPADIAYINAHGTGTALNDPSETRAIREALGSHADAVAVSSNKSQLGHALGAAGALEAIATVLAIQEGFAPPTLGYLGPDPQCDLDYVPNQSRPMAIPAALSHSFAFGGLNVVLAFRGVG
ncbi:MAG: beta-ketoacyl-[acyl-carrier-protein] synthase family protein [Verrucomicrobiae bacterium]|nr:beta-ketoacyl-[acyl-carrier-protein] synthase family protein [Verrucomicrobiae bacterium]